MGVKETVMTVLTLVGSAGGLLYMTEKAVGIDVINMVPVFPLIKSK